MTRSAATQPRSLHEVARCSFGTCASARRSMPGSQSAAVERGPARCTARLISLLGGLSLHVEIPVEAVWAHSSMSNMAADTPAGLIKHGACPCALKPMSSGICRCRFSQLHGWSNGRLRVTSSSRRPAHPRETVRRSQHPRSRRMPHGFVHPFGWLTDQFAPPLQDIFSNRWLALDPVAGAEAQALPYCNRR